MGIPSSVPCRPSSLAGHRVCMKSSNSASLSLLFQPILVQVACISHITLHSASPVFNDFVIVCHVAADQPRTEIFGRGVLRSAVVVCMCFSLLLTQLIYWQLHNHFHACCALVEFSCFLYHFILVCASHAMVHDSCQATCSTLLYDIFLLNSTIPYALHGYIHGLGS